MGDYIIMRPLQCALLQYDQSLYKKKKSEHTKRHQRHTHTQKKTIGGHGEKEVICKPRRAQVSEESKPASILVLDIQPPGL